MKKLLVILVLALIPSFAFATTVTASVAGTLKVYQTLSITAGNTMIFPAQFAGATAAALINVDGGAPATGIPNIVGDTQGRAGTVILTGTGGTQFNIPTVASTTPLTNGGSTFTPTYTLHGDAAFTTSPATAIPGTGNSQQLTIYVKGSIASGSLLVAGTYVGSATVSVSYN